MVLGNSLKNSLVSGFNLFQIGEFSFILALEGRRYGLITDDLYQAFLSASIITMIMTPLSHTGIIYSIAEWIARKSPLRFLERGKGKGPPNAIPGA
jgi:CPA2 family monovalent cation:H+ antiporter-2